jgi:hypothetical protein
MTEPQRGAMRAALSSSEVKGFLTKLKMQATEGDIESCPRYPHVLQLRSRSQQIEDRERSLAEAVCLREQDDVLLLGNTAAIEGFFLKKRHPIQLKGVGEDKPDPPPGVFVQAFLRAWQSSRGWTGIWLYVYAPKITVEFARQRWNTPGTNPKLEHQHLNKQIERVLVLCSNGWTELPLKLAGAP